RWREVLMPATLTGDGLGLTAVFSDGTRARFTLAGTGGPALACDLLAALAGLVHPHGELDAADSVRLYVAAARNMVNALAAGGFTGGAAELTRPMAAQYWLGAPAWAEGHARRLVQAAGPLNAEVASLA